MDPDMVRIFMDIRYSLSQILHEIKEVKLLLSEKDKKDG